MNGLVALIVLISSQGYWLGGTTGEVTLTWPADSTPPAAVLAWDLMLGPTRVTGGRVDVADARQGIRVRLNPPDVRASTPLRFVYRLTARGDGVELARGDLPVRVYPSTVLADHRAAYAGRRVVVIDSGDALHKALALAGVASERVATADNLAFLRPDVLIIAADSLPASPYRQPDVRALAADGVQVVIFRQTRAAALAGLAVARSPAPPDLRWELNHPLLRGLDETALADWARLAPAHLVTMSFETPATEIGRTKRDAEAGPIDTMLLAQSTGKGRLVLSQLPAVDFSTDPRGQVFLNNLLDYLLAAPEPTPSPAERKKRSAADPTTRRDTELPNGALP